VDLISSISNPNTLYSRPMVLSKPSPVPSERGFYGWFFREIPGIVPTDKCQTKGDLTLLYAGISPSREQSRQNLRKRIGKHYRGNAYGSTLRRSLGVLLTDESGFPLRRVGSGKCMTFTSLGEKWLDIWMEKNAFVCWCEHPSPWDVEASILRALSLPLNIQDNTHHAFAKVLSGLRTDAALRARQEPITR